MTLKDLLDSFKFKNQENLINEQLSENSLFVFTAIELTSNIDMIKIY